MTPDSTQRDIRNTPLFREADALYRAFRQPGTGLISDAAEVSTNGSHAVFASTAVDALEGLPATRLCVTDLATGDTRRVTFGPNLDLLPKYSPDGLRIAFLSDRHRAGNFQLYLLDPVNGAALPTPAVDGWVEYFHWSPDGTQILLGVADHGADVAGGQGAVKSAGRSETLPSWVPTVDAGNEALGWRRLWIYELATQRVRPVGAIGTNVWEAVWCGNARIAAVVSEGPGEGLWYSAHVALIDPESGRIEEIYLPEDQLGVPAGSPSGKHLAIVEAVCSDRGIIAGNLRLIDVASRQVHCADTNSVDISYIEWRSDEILLLAGHREFESVIGTFDVTPHTFSETWRSHEITTGGRYISISGLNRCGDCVLVGESFVRAPEIAVIERGEYRAIRSFDVGNGVEAANIDSVQRVNWAAPDGLDIQGWLLLPKGKAPYPLILNIHGGPVMHWRPTWLGRSGLHMLMLIRHGYAVFLPNPRGSGGRGQDFARLVKGDLNGADTEDYLSGLDHLVQEGLADPARIGVMGGSYGGNMTSWLITQDSRFAAAVSLAPHTNQVTEHLLSNIPDFVALFLGDHYTNFGGKYFECSPIMHAHKAKTPTLNVCGALDRCTPPEEAVQFHHALLENGVKSVLVTYPEEGHGIRRLPAVIDYAARVVAWFSEYMPAARAGRLTERSEPPSPELL